MYEGMSETDFLAVSAILMKISHFLLTPTLLITNLGKASISFSALKFRENTFPKTGRVVVRGPGGMFLNSYSTIR